MDIHWFPGHMAKALRETKQHLKAVDMVIEVCDARIPKSSRNPVLDEIIGTKPRLVVLNKSDMADDAKTQEWIRAYNDSGIRAIAMNSTNISGIALLQRECLSICAGKVEKALLKGHCRKAVRVMVAGIPNSGKSTLINTLSRGKKTATSDRPGVTRSLQWVQAGTQLQLLDMPGVLWPRIDHREGQILLAATGAIRDAVLDLTEIACEMFSVISQQYPQNIRNRYKIEPEGLSGVAMFEQAARKRGCILSGGRIDQERFAAVFLDEIRAGLAGKMTYESPEKKKGPQSL